MNRNNTDDSRYDLMIRACSNCNSINNIRDLHCKKCGEKLEGELTRKSRAPRMIAGMLSRVVKLLVLALFIAAGFALWPVTPTGETGSAQEFEAFNNELRLIKEKDPVPSVRHVREGTIYQEAAPFRQALSVPEGVANAFLESITEKSEQSRREPLVLWSVESANVAFNPNELLSTISTRVSVLPITWQFRHSFASKGQDVNAVLQSMRIGHLPIPLAAEDVATLLIEPLFQQVRQWLSFSPDEVEDVFLDAKSIEIRFARRDEIAGFDLDAVLDVEGSVPGTETAPGKGLDTEEDTKLPANGFDDDYMARRGMSPLHAAAVEGDVKQASLLLNDGADINVRDNRGNTPLDWAHYRAKIDMIEFLTKQGGKRMESDKADATE